MARVYKHCVVGHGLTGTAACKYLAKQGEDVVLVGPSEASGKAHGACYDEGRIYRILDPKESWARLAEHSVDHYEGIAQEAGVEFYKESGLLIFGVEDDFIRQTQAVAKKMGTALTQMSPSEIKEKYPWLGVPACSKVGLLQLHQAGHLSPRKLTHAQLSLATSHGASYLDRVVEKVTRSSTEAGHFVVSLANGGEVQAENVLVAAGCYTSLLPLLPEQVVISLTGAQAVLLEISADSAKLLSDMPSIIYEGETEEDCWYLLPPIMYPDGKWIVKIGPSTAFAPPLTTAAEVDAWFQRGSLEPALEKKALAAFAELFPSAEVVSWKPLLCVTDNTPKQNAYIDMLAPGWGICTGGNGWAAKSSDEIGLLAAQMMYLPDHWGPDPSLPREWFRATTQQALLPTPQLETAIARVDACGEVMLARTLQALELLTELLAKRPVLQARPPRLAGVLREELALLWDGAPTVLCTARGAAMAPGHPFITMSTDCFDVVVILPA